MQKKVKNSLKFYWEAADKLNNIGVWPMRKSISKHFEDALAAAGVRSAPHAPPTKLLRTDAERRSRVLELRDAIRAGKYSVGALDLADRLLEHPDLF